MKAKWIFSILTTIIIVVASVYSYQWIKKTVPKQLSLPSSLYVPVEDRSNEAVPQQLKEIIYESQKLVVKIELPDGSYGSGFLYNDKGDIITNAHVVPNVKEVKVNTADSRELTGEVIGISVDTDVAVVRVPELEGIAPMKVAKTRKAELGDEVIALGSPLGLQNTVTTGIVSGLGRSFNIDAFRYDDMYQISAPIAPGNSGGPLIDSRTGEVIGINSAILEQGVIGFSIPITNVLPLIDTWIQTPMQSLPRIGVNMPGNNSGSSTTNEDIATYIVHYFFESINYRDYVTAYSLLSSDLQSSKSYEDLRKEYMDLVNIEVDAMFPETKGRNVEVVATTTVQQRDESGLATKQYKVTLELGQENDQTKILSMKQERIDG